MNSRGVKPAMLVMALLFFVYCLGSWFVNNQEVTMVDVEYMDHKSFFPSELVARVESLEKKMHNFSVDMIIFPHFRPDGRKPIPEFLIFSL